jgi:hypothetical protein
MDLVPFASFSVSWAQGVAPVDFAQFVGEGTGGSFATWECWRSAAECRGAAGEFGGAAYVDAGATRVFAEPGSFVIGVQFWRSGESGDYVDAPSFVGGGSSLATGAPVQLVDGSVTPVTLDAVEGGSVSADLSGVPASTYEGVAVEMYCLAPVGQETFEPLTDQCTPYPTRPFEGLAPGDYTLYRSLDQTYNSADVTVEPGADLATADWVYPETVHVTAGATTTVDVGDGS